MNQAFTIFISTFATLLAIINPLEALPVFLSLTGGKDQPTRLNIARRSCVYALALMFFFLLFGTLILHLFGVPLSMVRITGGIILTKIGFQLFSRPAGVSMTSASADGDDVAFVPLAMPIMVGPGAIATILGMVSVVKHSALEALHFTALCVAIVLTMFTIYFCLAYADKLMTLIGPKGIDAVTRIVGFFVSAMGMALIFTGVIEAFQNYGIIAPH
jgi:multiple antibiotic resistance protein